MLLSLRSLQDAHEHVERQLEPSVFSAGEGDTFNVAGPVSLVFDIDRQEPGRYRLAGEVRGELGLNCSRCLEPFRLPVRSAFDLRYVPRVENSGEGEREIEEDDLSTAYYENDQIDLGQLVLEQLQLALPMKPLCSESCKGLCPKCGTNFNTGSCDCNTKWEDPRFAGLKTLGRN
jgi:uncharacterized protein